MVLHFVLSTTYIASRGSSTSIVSSVRRTLRRRLALPLISSSVAEARFAFRTPIVAFVPSMTQGILPVSSICRPLIFSPLPSTEKVTA